VTGRRWEPQAKNMRASAKIPINVCAVVYLNSLFVVSSRAFYLYGFGKHEYPHSQ
jgi:hypothetical protein